MIASVAGPTPDEVHFVDIEGWYGLTSYLGADVEEVLMDPSSRIPIPAYRPVWDTLEAELQEDANKTVVWVVPANERELFERRLSEENLESRAVCFDGLHQFVVYGAPVQKAPMSSETPALSSNRAARGRHHSVGIAPGRTGSP